MILRTCNLEEFIKRIDGRKVICFGAGKLLSEFCDEFKNFSFEKYISCIVDNNPLFWGTKKCLNGTEICIMQPDYIYEGELKNTVILITCGGKFGLEIFNSLYENNDLAGIECYFAKFIMETQRDVIFNNAIKEPIGFRKNPKRMIPKKIHYCWVGGNPIPEKYRKCIDSWKRFCPDYEIIEWNESNYDFKKNKYMRQAYDSRKWGFVPDYARLDIIYTHGGIYLDTDVEIVKPLDELLYNEAFCGFESVQYVNLGSGFGGVSGFPLFREMMDHYNDISFINEDGSLNLIASPVIQTESLLKHGLKLGGGFQVIEELTVYPIDYFAPLSLGTRYVNRTRNTYSIHWFDGSWLSEEQRSSNDVYSELFLVALENEIPRNAGNIVRS